MTKHLFPMCLLAAGVLLTGSAVATTDDICPDRAEFEKEGWQQEPVQRAMDDYLRDHRMRVNWLKEPRPPSAVGRDYYEWLWMDEFGATMKAELVQRYCGAAGDSSVEE